jgi:hypothetical protein
MFLNRTVQDVLEHSTADTEIIVVLDGAWPETPLEQHPRLQVVYVPESIGQRAATNLAASISQARYVCKLDAHCAVAPGWDTELIRAAGELGPDVTQIPAQKNLHVHNWRCEKCGTETYQCPIPTDCNTCQDTKRERGGPFTRVMIWKPRGGTTTTCWTFNAEPRFQYGGTPHREMVNGIGDVMTSLGACFFLARERFWQLGGLDESYGSWGSLGIEVALKSWLSGGRHVTNANTFFAHFFRVGGLGFPYPITGAQQERARKRARDIWFNNAWEGQVRPLSWLVDKFAPIPGWHDAPNSEVLNSVTRKGLSFERGLAVAFGAEPRCSSSDTLSHSVQSVSSGAFSLATIDVADGTDHVDVVPVRNQIQVGGVATLLDAACVVDDHPVHSASSVGEGSHEPCIHKAVDKDVVGSVETGFAVSLRNAASGPEPATGSLIDGDFRKESREGPCVQVRDGEILPISHDAASSVSGLGASARSQRADAPSIVAKSPTKSVLYYSDGNAPPEILQACRRTIEWSGLPIVAVTLAPINWPAATNIVVPRSRGYLTLFKQILIGLIAAESDVVFFAEHDVAYHRQHWTFTPPSADRYWYQMNWWKVNAETGHAITYTAKQTSQLCADRQLLIEHYRKRIAMVEAQGFSRRTGFEPGTHRRPERVDDLTSDTWMSPVPNIDIRHGRNLTPSRWNPNQFRDKRNCAGWTEADEIPGWGLTKGRFDAFLTEHCQDLVSSAA